MTAKIGLEDVRFFAPHGFYEEEHRMGNEFSIDVEVEASIGGAAEDDDLGATVNYATIYYLLQMEMKKPTLLLEALAYRMSSRILNQFDNVSSVTLRLRKLSPPLGGKVGAAVVEVTVGAGGNGASSGGYGGAINSRHTFEDDDYDEPDDGPFSGGGGGGGGDYQPYVPPPAPAPMPSFDGDFDDFADDDYGDDDYYEEDGDLIGDDFLSEEELAAMTAEDSATDEELSEEELLAMLAAGGGGGGEAGEISPEDFDEVELPDDFDFDSIDFDGMDFDDLDLGDLGDYNPDEFK